MSGVDQLQYLSWLLYLVVFVLVFVRARRRPTPAHVDMALFFGAVAITIVVSTLGSRLPVRLPSSIVDDVASAAVLALGYLLLRLVRDFSRVPTLLMRAVELGLVAAILAIIVAPRPISGGLAFAMVAYLVAVIGYGAWAFTRQASRTRGVTRRRMQAAAIGSICVGLALVVAGFAVAAPELSAVWDELGALFGLASGACYFVGFAPPTWLRRAWQEPEVRAFLARAVHLAGMSDFRDIVRELEYGAADAFGAPTARIALWDRDRQRLQIVSDSDVELPARLSQAWVAQRPTLASDVPSTDEAQTSLFRAYGASAALSAPITAFEKRIGVLVVFAPRAPVFANSDLELIQLLAVQAAVILESKTLIDAAAQVRAREEAARLKEDFLSSAAHDLKTPLTGIVTQAQVLQRRAQRDPTAPADRVGLDRLLEQSHRLKKLVLELLDVSRLEQGSLIGERDPTDLADLVRTLAQHEAARWNQVQVNVNGPVLAWVDATRFEQVVTNLVENALKYSPQQTPVRIDVWREDGEARLSVRDEGIGIPADDQPLVFERFHRARNVDDRRFAGMGLGLYIARGIVEQHGGRIWVDSTPGVGSTFHVAVPATAPELSAPEQARPERVTP
jgi:signal transduction histidine kinase